MPSNYKTVINFRDGIQVDTDDLISNNGLVGIGSTIPRQQLDVRGNVIVSENSEFNNVKVTGITSFQNDVAVSSGSSVGIGTSVPEAAFQVGVGTTGFTVSETGVVNAVEYYGSGANLTNIPASVWTNPGAGNTIFTLKDVGIGTEQPRDGADFGVGFEILMDAESGIGTFEGIVTKNITVLNQTGAGQGNVEAEVGTFSTITATSNITGSLIGNADTATLATNSQGLTGTPDITVNSIVSGGGTFSNLTEFDSIQVSGGITASNGIVTATTFSGTATTSLNASIAYAIGGDPDIQVDSVDINGTAPTFLRGAGVSTVGEDLRVGNFLGVGNTVSAVGDAGGFIGTVRVHNGDLILGGSISIGGSLVGSVELGSTQNINVLNVGAGLSVAGISTFQGTVTGGADFNVTGTVTAGELDATDSSNIGGGQTIGSGLVVGNTVAGSDIRVLNGGGLIIGSGITMNGDITGVDDITATGAISGGNITGANLVGSNLNVAGISTLGSANCSNLSIAGGLNVTGVGTISTGQIKIDGLTGVVSAVGYRASGVSTFTDLLITGGQNTRMFSQYVGVNTGVRKITDGVEIYRTQSELFMDAYSQGIGIGTTSGDRLMNSKLYVGYGRNGNALLDSVSIFESGSIGIGTTAVEATSQGVEGVDIYRNIRLFGGHTGMGGTVGVATNVIQVGFNTTQPGGALDMRSAGAPLCLPVCEGNTDNSGMSFFHSDGDHIGNIWFSKHDMKLRVAMGQGSANFIGMVSETYGKTLNDWMAIRGFKGPIFESEQSKTNQTPTFPVDEPVGWTTSNMGYFSPTHQIQVYCADDQWRSLVGSATTGYEIITVGNTAVLNLVGVGSIVLGTFS
tara:strand:- start:14989 stop:17550 length:2562 start_codon:yes stop_codon:yes gene_type:complete